MFSPVARLFRLSRRSWFPGSSISFIHGEASSCHMWRWSRTFEKATKHELVELNLPARQTCGFLHRMVKRVYLTKAVRKENFQDDGEEDPVGDEDPVEEWEEDHNDGDEIGITTAGTEWGKTALAILQGILADKEGLEVYSFRAVPSNKRMYVRIDKLSDQYGSPSLEELEDLSACFNTALEASLGSELAGQLEIEMSSPGAERDVRVPQDLVRFQELPMQVEYKEDEESDTTVVRIFNFIGIQEEEGGKATWRLADVRANRPGKGRGLSKKEGEKSLPRQGLQL